MLVTILEVVMVKKLNEKLDMKFVLRMVEV